MKSTIFSKGILQLNKSNKGFILEVVNQLNEHRERFKKYEEILRATNDNRLLSAYLIFGNTVYFVTNPAYRETIVLLPNECGYYEKSCHLL